MTTLKNEGWDAKYVPDAVKAFIAGQAVVVQDQYKTTLLTMANAPGNTGDGALKGFGHFHKRFGGHWCLMYQWLNRRDGQGKYLAVKGIGRKNGNGNDYDQVV